MEGAAGASAPDSSLPTFRMAERMDEAAERAIVAALEGIAQGGREALALEGLRRGADAGSVEAALALVRRSGASELDRAGWVVVILTSQLIADEESKHDPKIPC